MTENRYTIAVLTAKDGRVDELIGTLAGLAEATRTEPGCIEYGFYRDVTNANTVISFERWVDTAAEDAHWETTHLNDALQALESVLEAAPAIHKANKII